jgi:hypothetical protein
MQYSAYLLGVLMMLFLAFLEVALGAEAFFEQRHRGWLWFDERERQEETHHQDVPKEQDIKELAQVAKQENEAFAAELELLRHLAVRHPENLEYVLAYKKKEQEMYDNAGQLAKSWLMVNFLNPDLVDELENPQNIYGRDSKKQYEEQQKQANLKFLAGQIEIFVLRQDGCIYCQILEKHLEHFAHNFGFVVEAIAPDNSQSPYFPTHNSPEMIKALNTEIMPVVIAVVKDTRERFELARGAVSVIDLQEKALMLFEHLGLQAPSILPQATDKNLANKQLGGCSSCISN